MQILFATNNAHKVVEVQEILRGTGVSVQTLAEAGLDIDPPEDHDTFAANAIQKADTLFKLTGRWTIADDSGIEVDALGGAPGVFSKRFSPQATAEANNALLLDKLHGQANRTGRYRCVIALVGPGHTSTAEGRCEGVIATTLIGKGGFGYDPLFLPAETPGLSMAQLDMDAKNVISHRGRAFRQLAELVKVIPA